MTDHEWHKRIAQINDNNKENQPMAKTRQYLSPEAAKQSHQKQVNEQANRNIMIRESLNSKTSRPDNRTH
jgi:hypothetical protein